MPHAMNIIEGNCRQLLPMRPRGIVNEVQRIVLLLTVDELTVETLSGYWLIQHVMLWVSITPFVARAPHSMASPVQSSVPSCLPPTLAKGCSGREDHACWGVSGMCVSQYWLMSVLK